MTKKPWTPEREAALLAKAEKGLKASEIGPAVPNPLRKAGRPSLSPEGGTSKALNTRIPSDLHGKVIAFARKTGRSVSDLTRDALNAFMSSDSDLDVTTPGAVAKRATRATKATSGRRATSRATGASAEAKTRRGAKSVKTADAPASAKPVRKARTAHN